MQAGRVTKLLGLLQGTVATLTAASVIPESHLKYWMAALAVLTYWRGQFTAAQAVTLTEEGK